MDWETQSLVNIRKEGGVKYCKDPSTRVSCCAFMQEDVKTMWLLPDRAPAGTRAPDGWELHLEPEPPPWVLEAVKNGATLCAHNAAGFDKLIWDRFVGVDCSWVDSAPMCRAAGLSGHLDKACKALFGVGKSEGYALINLLCVAKPMGDRIAYPVATAAAWETFLEYCASDVELLHRLFQHVYQYAEHDVLAVDQIVNERGIPVDAAFAARICMIQEELKVKRADEFAELTDIDAVDARSPKKLREWLARINVRLPLNADGKESLDRKELTRLFKDPDAFYDGDDESELAAAVAAIKMRLEITKSTAGKALAVVKAVDPDGRVRYQEVYHGAHTGRWSARQMQPHNFPKGVKGVPLEMARTDLTLAEVEECAAKIGKPVSDVLGTLLRPIIRAPEGCNLCIADYGAVEARGLAWMCDEPGDLEEFNKWNADPYCPMASQLFGRPITKADETERFIGKALILGCGYSMSWRKFILYCANAGVDLAAVGVDAQAAVKAYRQSRPRIVDGWARLHHAAQMAVQGQASSVCKCLVDHKHGDLRIQLPSGRRLRYRNARLENKVPAYASLFAFRMEPVPTVVYDHPHGYDGILYGGLLMENIVQACCRDILADHLIKAEAAGLHPVLHVHDEVVTESDDLRALTQIMCTPPAWAPGFPLYVESFKYHLYTKSPPKSAEHMAGLNGVLDK